MYITICERKAVKILGKTEDGNNYVSGNGLRNGNRSDRQFWVLSVEERGIPVCLPLP